jgi:hypothetical protein
MAEALEIQEIITKLMNNKWRSFFSRKYKRAFKHYSALFDDTLKYRFSMINYCKIASDIAKGLYRDPEDNLCRLYGINLEKLMPNHEKKLEEKREKWVKKVSEIALDSMKNKINLKQLEVFARDNKRYTKHYLGRYLTDEETYANCREIDYTADTIEKIMNDHDTRMSIIGGKTGIIYLGAPNILSSVESSFNIDWYIPLLRRAVNLGYIDQEDAHLAIIRGKKQVKSSKENS